MVLAPGGVKRRMSGRMWKRISEQPVMKRADAMQMPAKRGPVGEDERKAGKRGARDQ